MATFLSSQPQTKIIATLGPASENLLAIEALFNAGARVFRLNFSHGTEQWHRQCAEAIRQVSAKYQTHLAILADLQGPKVRLGLFEEGKVYLQAGQSFSLLKECDLGNAEQVGLDCPELLKDLKVGDELLMDDGKFSLKLETVSSERAEGRVQNSGWLASKKGLNKRGGGFSIAGLTQKDQKDLKFSVELGVDYLGLSFVRTAADVQRARTLLENYGSHARLVAKIECAEAVSNVSVMREIIGASDVIMVARGDLGVEIGDALLAITQKRLIFEAQQLGVPVITATQMMESMIEAPIPTRAEVLDLSNAILDGSAAVMLSAETTVGKYPVETVKKVQEIARGVEKNFFSQRELRALKMPHARLASACCHPDPETTTILKAAAFAACVDSEIAAIFACTTSAQTILALSSFCHDLPIFSISESSLALQQSQMCRGVYPLFFPALSSSALKDQSVESFEGFILKFAVEQEWVLPDQKVLFLHGRQIFVPGGSNTIRISRA